MNVLNENVNKIIEFCKKYKNIIIYGDGSIGRTISLFLQENEINVLGFAVTEKVVHNSIGGISVKTIAEYKKKDSKQEFGFLVCVNPKWFDSIKEILINFGFFNYLFIDNDLFWELFNNTDFDNISFENGARNISVLMYHRIDNNNYDSFDLTISKEIFEEQIRAIKENYNIIRSDDDWSGIKKESIIITFDDGYVDFYDNTYPILKKYDVPATVFVSTGNIGTNNEFWWDILERLIIESSDIPELINIKGIQFFKDEYASRESLLFAIHKVLLAISDYERKNEIDFLKKQIGSTFQNRKKYRTMNENEIKELADSSLITIGAHTVSHIICDKESTEIQQNEIIESKRTLEKITGKPINVFAYPNGGFNDITQKLLFDCGFIRGYTVELGNIGNNTNPYRIPRNMVYSWRRKDFQNALKGINKVFRVVE